MISLRFLLFQYWFYNTLFLSLISILAWGGSDTSLVLFFSAWVELEVSSNGSSRSSRSFAEIWSNSLRTGVFCGITAYKIKKMNKLHILFHKPYLTSWRRFLVDFRISNRQYNFPRQLIRGGPTRFWADIGAWHTSSNISVITWLDLVTWLWLWLGVLKLSIRLFFEMIWDEKTNLGGGRTRVEQFLD